MHFRDAKKAKTKAFAGKSPESRKAKKTKKQKKSCTCWKNVFSRIWKLFKNSVFFVLQCKMLKKLLSRRSANAAFFLKNFTPQNAKKTFFTQFCKWIFFSHLEVVENSFIFAFCSVKCKKTIFPQFPKCWKTHFLFGNYGKIAFLFLHPCPEAPEPQP